MVSGRIERIMLGTIIPPTLSGLLYSVLILINSLELDSIALFPFIMLGFIWLAGIPSFLYSLLMEFAIQKINNDKLVIFMSMLFSGGLGKILGEIYWDPLIMLSIGCISGLIVGCYLRWHMMLKPANKALQQD